MLGSCNPGYVKRMVFDFMQKKSTCILVRLYPIDASVVMQESEDVSSPSVTVAWVFLGVLGALCVGCCVTGYMHFCGPTRHYQRMGEQRQQALAKYGVDLDDMDLDDDDNYVPPQKPTQTGLSGAVHTPASSSSNTHTQQSSGIHKFVTMEIG